MKKFLSFLALACFMVTGAWAVDELGTVKKYNELTDGMEIALKCCSRTNDRWLYIASDKVTSKETYDAECTFVLVSNGSGKFYLKSKSTNKYIKNGTNGNNCTLTESSNEAAPFSLVVVTTCADGDLLESLTDVTRFSLGTTYLNCQAAGGTAKFANGTGSYSFFKVYQVVQAAAKTYTVNITGAPEGTKVTYNSTQYGNGDEITGTALAATDFTAENVEGYTVAISISGTNINVVYTPMPFTVGKTYRLTLRGGQVVYDANSDQFSVGTATTSVTDKNSWFTIGGNSAEGYTLYNVGCAKYLYHANTANDNSKATTTENEADATKYIWKEKDGQSFFLISGTSDQYVNKRDNYFSTWKSSWGYGDTGSVITFEEVDMSVDAAYKVAKAEAEAILTNAANLSALYTSTAISTATTAINGITYDASNETSVNEAIAALNGIMDTFYASANGKKVALVSKTDWSTRGATLYLTGSKDAAAQLAAIETKNVYSVFSLTYSTGNKAYSIQNTYTPNNYVGQPGNNSSPITGSTTPVYFTITPQADKENAIVEAISGNAFRGIHVDGSKNIVVWDAAAGASQWAFEAVSDEDYNALIPSEVTYTVNITGAPSEAKLTYNGTDYANEATFKATDLQQEELSATEIAGYSYTISIEDTDVNVVYTANDINASIDYTPLNTSCWSTWSGDVPDGISTLDATNYTATNLRVIAKTYVIAEAGTLQSTFVYTTGNNRTDIVGVDVVDASGNVVSADYHNGFSGGNKQNHVYTVTIPAGTITVRYITTTASSDGSNINTNGHIDNVFTLAGGEKTYAFVLTDAEGNEYEGTFTSSKVEPRPECVEGLNPTNEEWEDVSEIRDDVDYLYTADITFPFPVNTPTAISGYKGNGGNDQFWWRAVGTDIVVKKNDAAVGNDYAWVITPNFVDNTFFYTINSYTTGKYVKVNASGSNHNQGAVTLDETANATYFTYTNDSFKVLGETLYLSVNSSNTATEQYVGVHTSIHAGSKMHYGDVTNPGLDITIGELGYATFYDEVDRIIPEGVTAYYCEESVSGYLKPIEITTGVIPAYVGTVLEGTPNTYTLVEGDGTAEYIDESCLYGVTEDYDTQDLIEMYEYNFEVTPTIYVFSKKNDAFGFYKYVGSTLGAHKAFYVTIPEAGVNGFTLDFGGQTVGVNSVISATNLKAGYDILGRRINKVQKGINILGGKKIIK